MRGKLIVFEGVEGCGKTTQLNRLYAWMEQHELLRRLQSKHQLKGVIMTREPGGTPLGQQIRDWLLHQPQAGLQNRAELLLYAADRAQHVATCLQPALEAGYLVLCDRYTDSTVAYQGYGRQLDLALITTLNQIATGGLDSDLTLWLSLPVETGLTRLRARGQADRIEQSGLAFHRRVQSGFEALARQHPHRITSIDAGGSEAEIAAQIQDVLTTRLQQWYPLPSQI
jgi:dTMP kinase